MKGGFANNALRLEFPLSPSRPKPEILIEAAFTMTNSIQDLEQFYSLIARLAEAPWQAKPLRELPANSAFPKRGVYFFMEPGEYRALQPEVLRVVRVGTHAVSNGSKSTLRARLKQHFGTRGGGGNHRGSIFRRHVGDALLARDKCNLEFWGIGSTASTSVRATESEHEKQVSEILGAMSVLWIKVPDEASRESDRAFIERNSIALLSNQFAPLDTPTMGWLGRFSPRREIRESSLWNLNHVNESYHPLFLEKLAYYVEQTINCG